MRNCWNFTDIKDPVLSNRLCQFGLLEVVVPAVVGTLTAAGVGATTAGAIGTLAGTAAVYGGAGALAGGAAELIKGGKPFKGALTGAGIGATVGAGMAAPGVLTAAFPQTMGALGLATNLPSYAFPGATQATLGEGGTWAAGAGGFPEYASMGANGAYAPGAAGFADNGTALQNSLENQWADATQGSEAGMPATAKAAAASGELSGQGVGALSKLSSTAKALGAAASLLQPRNPTYANMPGSATTAGAAGPIFGAPAINSGYINRNPTTGQQPQAPLSWYSYGNGPEQSFFNNNQVTFPALNVARYAEGGRTFDSRRGDKYVPGQDGGQDDTVDAKLSPGEFVIDASTVSALGDGNNEAGAKKLDVMRQAIAKHKGFKHVIQPKSKSPLQYMKKRAA